MNLLLPSKDKVPKYLRSSVVYLFKCRCCSASYVGQTTRHLHTRISEHLGISPITGKHSTNPAISSIFSHTNASGQPANFDDFQILSSSSDSYELMIHESLLYTDLILVFKAALFPLTSSKLSFMSYVFVTSHRSSHFHIFPWLYLMALAILHPVNITLLAYIFKFCI